MQEMGEMQDKYLLSLDQGTTSSRAIIFDRNGEVVSQAQKEVTQHYPKPGWVEHDAGEIWSTQAGVAAEATTHAGLNGTHIAAIGITNQRETTIAWDKNSGRPVYRAIVWQDRRTSDVCKSLREQGYEKLIREKTGLIIDAYFSATKIKWILDNVEGAREKAYQGSLAFGTVDSWLIWKFTRGRKHVTDVTNASRTMLFNIHTLDWDDEILDLLEIPRSVLPEIKPSSHNYGETATTIFASKVPLCGIAGDQQASLFGQMCIEPGMVKNTYGTGSFMVLNTGTEPVMSQHNLLTTLAWQLEGRPAEYALEGSIFVTGAVMQWLRDGLGIIRNIEEAEELAKSVPDNGGVYFVPAFSGLGAPHWDQYARGTITGLTLGVKAAHITRAALESIGYQTRDVLTAMRADSSVDINELRVDGGATVNQTLMQFQADILQIPVLRSKVTETTALGAAYLAGLAVGYWRDINEIRNQWRVAKTYQPMMKASGADYYYKNWQRALSRSKQWLEPDEAQQ